MKIIDLDRTVHSLTEEYPEIIDIMVDLGFDAIANPATRNTAGRFITIPNGARMQGIDLATIIATFEEHGFVIKSE